MRISGDSTLEAAADAIWPLIFDPRTLMELLPGCEQIEQTAPDEYTGRLVLPLPAVAGTYDMHVKVLRVEPPSFCELQGEARGAVGAVQGRAAFTLHPEGSHTRIAYEGDAMVSGPLGGMNPRFVEGVAQTLIRQGLARLPELAQSRAAAAGERAGTYSSARPPLRGGLLRRLLQRFLRWARRPGAR